MRCGGVLRFVWTLRTEDTNRLEERLHIRLFRRPSGKTLKQERVTLTPYRCCTSSTACFLLRCSCSASPAPSSGHQTGGAHGDSKAGCVGRAASPAPSGGGARSPTRSNPVRDMTSSQLLIGSGWRSRLAEVRRLLFFSQ